jgi:cytochrome c peroxidase
MRRTFGLLAALALAAVPAAAAPPAGGGAAPAVKTVHLSLGDYAPPPLGLDPLPIPKDNPQSPEKIALGRLLFFDGRLSADGTVSCASCHNPKLGWSNGLSLAFGIKGQTGTRSAPTVLNAAYADTLFWDGRAPSLEAQAKGPIANPVEMGATYPQVVAALSAVPAYVDRFRAAFGDGRVTIERVVRAIAAYERTLLSGNSPFDRYKYGGDKGALTPAQVRGLALFKDKDGPNCAKCHRFDDFAADFTDFRFHNIGVGIDRPDPDIGREAVTHRAEDKGRFRTPTLRNVALTAPYMHDGRFATLEQVVDFYAGGGHPNPNLDPDIHRFDLTPAQKADLIAFLSALTGDLPPGEPPRLPESSP